MEENTNDFYIDNINDILNKTDILLKNYTNFDKKYYFVNKKNNDKFKLYSKLIDYFLLINKKNYINYLNNLENKTDNLFLKYN